MKGAKVSSGGAQAGPRGLQGRQRLEDWRSNFQDKVQEVLKQVEIGLAQYHYQIGRCEETDSEAGLARG